MKNNKGFVMTETLVVTVFLVSIFTFIYVSIIPLMGRYEDMINREEDIDIVYKLYNIRKLIETDGNKSSIISSGHNTITCNSFSSSNRNYCNKLMEYLNLSNYSLVYVNNIFNNLNYIKGISEEMYDYIKKYQKNDNEVLILLDKNRHTIAHLFFDQYYGDTLKPINYSFNEMPTISSSTTPPTDSNVYFGLFSDGLSGVCIKMGKSEYCFKNNDYEIEKEHIQNIFTRNLDKCNVTTNKTDCENNNIYCSLESTGKVTCRDKVLNKSCNITATNVYQCS